MIHGFDPRKELFGQVLLDTRQWPFRGMVYSLVVHTMTFSAILAISVSGVLSQTAPRRPSAPPGSELDLREVVYLPVMAPAPALGAASGQAPPEGLAYPGPQTIASELPDPTSGFQTVFGPGLEDPAVLETTVPLPNMVQMADRPAVIQAEAPTREVLFAPVPPTPEAASELVPELLEPPLDVGRDVNFEALAEAVRALEPLPASELPLGLPERDLGRSEPPRDLAALAPEPSPLQPLPARRVDLALPMRTLEPVQSTTDLSALSPGGSEPVRPLPSRPVEVGLPTRSLASAPSDPVALDALAGTPEAIQPLPSRPVRQALPTRALARGDALDLEGLTPADRPASPGLPVAQGPASTPGPRPLLSPLAVPPAGGVGRQTEDFVALSPMPATEPGVLPPGESRGLFVISTVPSLETSETRPGVRPEDAGAAGEGRPERIGPLLGNDPDVAGAGENADAAASEDGAGPAFPGITILAGGAGPRPETTPGDEPRAGISVVGGSVESPDGRPEDPTPPDPERGNRPGDLQQSYGITVLSTDAAGGGLPRFGVFTDEQVHTVFFDMRRTLADPAPTWTVEYGVPRGSRVQANLDADAAGIPQGFLLPFPVERHQPAFSAQMAARYPEQLVIAYGVIGVDGRIGDAVVKRSPDERLEQPVLDALSKWTFRPGRLDGAPVPVKILLGIPVWVAE